MIPFTGKKNVLWTKLDGWVITTLDHSKHAIWSFKFNLFSDEPVISLRYSYLESMARTALGDSYILVCICQFRLFLNLVCAILLFRLPKHALNSKALWNF